MNKRNDFICIGAVHPDYILKLKQNYFKNRTNPINHQENLGGVAYNVAKMLSFLNQKTKLYSLNCNKIQRKEIISKGIKFKALNRKIFNRYYASVLDIHGKMVFGLANMDYYEKFTEYNNSLIFINKRIILDLNLSSVLIRNIVNVNYKKNYICICGTSAHKVYKIKNLLKKINTIILNKQESLNLTKKDSIKDSLNFLIKKNRKLNIIITNGKNAVNAYINNVKYITYPPHTNLRNENGAGDTLIAIFNYFYNNSFNDLTSLNKGICGGSLQASEYTNTKQKYLQKINKISRLTKTKVVN